MSVERGLDPRPAPQTYTPALGHRALTPLYDAVIALATRENVWRGRLIDAIALKAGERLLDVGCGIRPSNTRPLPKHRPEPTGRDRANEGFAAPLGLNCDAGFVPPPRTSVRVALLAALIAVANRERARCSQGKLRVAALRIEATTTSILGKRNHCRCCRALCTCVFSGTRACRCERRWSWSALASITQSGFTISMRVQV